MCENLRGAQFVAGAFRQSLSIRKFAQTAAFLLMFMRLKERDVKITKYLSLKTMREQENRDPK